MAKIVAGIACSHVPAIGVAMDRGQTATAYWEPLFKGYQPARDWLGMLKVGGNIYYTIKIAFCDGLTFQDVAGMMSGVPKETYAKMMLAGGRSPDGNRYKDAGVAAAEDK